MLWTVLLFVCNQVEGETKFWASEKFRTASSKFSYANLEFQMTYWKMSVI